MARGGRVIYKRAGGRNRKIRSRAADDDDDEDQDYVLGEEDEEDSESFEESYASSVDASEEEFEFGESSGGSDEEEEIEEEEDEVELARSKPRRRASNGWRTIKKPRVLDDEEEFSLTRKRARSGSRRKKSRDSDYEEEEEDDDDEDFSPGEDEDEEDEVFLISGRKSGCRRKGSSKQGRKKRKSGVLNQKREKKRSMAPARKRRRRARISDEDDDDFIVKDRIAVDKKRKTRKKGRKTKTTTSRAARKISLVDSETSDFEYMTSDDDFVEKDRIALDNKRNKSKKGRKKTAAPRTRKRSPSSVGSDSESSDCDYVISEEELRDLGVGGILSQPQSERIFARRKGEEKGKEKEADESGKQVCGICLSEEQMGTIQGVLNCCAHYFCFACIMEWSKVESRCPVCKRRFMTITKSSRSDPGFGLRKAVIRVQKRDQVYQPSEEEMRGFLDPYENVVCIECQQGGDDNLMLLCDICDSPAHTYCVGLGREVPEGNWYCELCRSPGEGSSNSQLQDNPTDQRASSGDLFPGGWKTEDVSRDMHASRNSQMSVPWRGQSSQRIDLNVSPRHFTEEDHGVASQASGGGASTLSGRRAIHRHIRILLSNSRPRQIISRVNVPLHNRESNAITSGIEQSGEASHVTEGVNSLQPVSSIEQHQQNIRPFQSGTNLAPCTYSEGNSFRHVEGAKEKVQSIVKGHLRNLCRDFPLVNVGVMQEIA
ncbi:putative PHD and RING finger domain-containing protein 1 [Cocos nucifera]|nr:putative PHD and RING finger domain-containing protein 1 [Cocos nucifera]